MTDTDSPDMLIQVEEELRRQGVTVALARVHPPVFALWERAGAIDAIGAGMVFATVREAVRTASARRPGAQHERGKGARS